ncbi:hypothetical protein GJAV_G00059350 [Gymnothorax javanicus]|nr:hypothetical protein GJAV_G00059350 [Gymnothorax javanicus]
MSHCVISKQSCSMVMASCGQTLTFLISAFSCFTLGLYIRSRGRDFHVLHLGDKRLLQELRQMAFDMVGDATSLFPEANEQSVQEVPTGLDSLSQDLDFSSVPVLTPCSKAVLSQALKESFSGFTRVQHCYGISSDPYKWSKTEVIQWLQWAAGEFSLPNIEFFRFDMSGQELCGMGKECFLDLAPDFAGDILWEHLDQMKEGHGTQTLCDTVPSVSGLVCSAVLSHEQSAEDNDSHEDAAWSSHSHRGDAQRVPSHDCFDEDCSSGPVDPGEQGPIFNDCRPGRPRPVEQGKFVIPAATTLGFMGSGQIQLWQFLLEQLFDESCHSFISWTGNGWEFRFTDPDEVARRWGLRKNKPRMNYEKLSGGLRYYYHKNIIRKTTGERFVYRFVCDPKSLLGCAAKKPLDQTGVEPYAGD